MFGIDSTWSGLVGRIGRSRIIPGVVVAAALAATAPSAVSATELIADLNVLGRLEGFDSFGGDAVVLDDRYYIFPATVEHLGREPWVLDTNTGDVQLLGDLSPGSSSSSPSGFVAIAGAVLFAATTPEFGTELWITDGTPAGTQLLLDINPGSASSSPAELYTPNGSGVLFRANDGVSGNELWRSNGTVAGTFQVADINPGAASSSPVEFVLFGAHVYFRAIDATHGSELWRVSTAGVVSLVVDIEPGASSSTPVFLAVAAITPAPQLVFRACRAPEGCEVWRSDGSPAGTTLLADLHPTGSSNPSSFVWHDGLSRIFFTASDGSFGTELWQIQPGVGASRVTDIQVGSLSSSPQGLGVLPSRLVFTANDGGSGTRLFSFDGTTVSQIRNLSTAGVPNSPSNTVTWLDQVYFYEGGGCWRTDGTAAGTVGWSCVSDLGFAIGGGWLFFGQSLSFVRDIWSIDAANVFSRRTEALSYASDPAEATWLGSSGAFAADDGVSGREPWWWDGSGAPVVLDLAPGAGSSNPKDLVAFDGRVWFGATTPATGYELFSSDGTLAGTTTYDFDAGPSFGLGGAPTVAGGKLYVSAQSPALGYHLARFDGHGSSPVAITVDGDTDIDPDALVVVGDRLYFTAYTDATGREWFSVGPGETTATSHEVVAGAGEPSDLEEATGWDGWLYFLADDNSGLQVWRANLTTVGVVTGLASMSTSYTSSLVAGPGGVYFVHDNDPTGVELWRTDGVSTTLVADLDPGTDSSYPSRLTAIGGFLYFEANAPDTGSELYRTTGLGVELVADVNPGANSSSPGELVALGDRVVFSADDGVSGRELWITRDDGASRLPEAWVGPGASNPEDLSAAPDGTRVVFSAVTLATWREPFVVDIRLFADGFETGNTSAWSATVP